MRAFWPVGEAAQADYERLRTVALDGVTPSTPAWLRFQRHGLVGLITSRASDPVFNVRVVGVTRPPWSPHGDPRLETLAAGYEFILAAGPDRVEALEITR